jgi:hypothetical protein
MRTDLTAAFESELDRAGRAPVQLLAFFFPIAGTVRVSDRDLGPADGLAQSWHALVEDWGVLEDITGTSDPAEITIEARQMTVTLLNRGTVPFSDYFLKEDPEGVTAELYQWFAGLTDDDRILIDRFVIADPIRFSERGRLVALDLVSDVVNMDAICGNLLSAADWPNAKTDDVGKAIDLPFGTVGRLPTLCAKTAPAATLSGSILANTLTIPVSEDLDALAFSAAGTVQIGEELIRYGSRTASVLNAVQRGYLSTAAEHLDREAIIELIEDHTYIIGRGPIQSISDVQVGGYPAPAGIYSVSTGTDPAKILFNQKPYAFRFAAGSTFLEMQFDTIGAGNTAFQPYKAYDAGDDATAARIDKDHRILSLKQTTINPDRGAIVRAYLAVEHWESAPMVNDYAEVWVEGVGVVGRLSRASTEEGIAIEADVDIDHGHNHAIGGEHSHAFYDPVLQTDETPHTHLTQSSGITNTYPPPSGDDAFSLNAPYDTNVLGETKTITFTGLPGYWAGALLKFKCSTGGVRLYAVDRYVASGERSISLGKRTSGATALTVRFLAYGDGIYFAKAQVWDLHLEITEDTIVVEAQTGASTQVAVSGKNANTTSDKKANDVKSLASDNVPVSFNVQDSSTRSHVNLFDLSANVNFNWAWFNDRDIRVTYTGSLDNKSVYILHCFFDVEYRARERFFSDDVTAQVVGLIDDGAGTSTGTAGALITRPDHVLKRLFVKSGAIAADRVDTASFAAAGVRLAEKSYTVDGVFRGSEPIKEAIKRLAYQVRVRPFWSAGFLKLAFVEALADWPVQRQIATGDYQLHSIAVERQPVRAIVNQVDLFYARDWTKEDDGPAGYAKSTRASDTASIARFGIRNDPGRFLFDLIRSAAMAADLAAFYADRFATPSAFYRVNCYLSQFDLEKEDKISLSANWNRLLKAKMRVLGMTRAFGSGKNRSINLFELLLECLRYILLEHGESDMVLALDALDVSVGKEGEFAESLAVFDALAAGIGPALSEVITIEDALALVQEFGLQNDESISLADDLAHGIGIGIQDTAKILDDVDGWRQFGFGGGQFGIVGFGGWVVWYNRAPDEVAVFDEILANFSPSSFAEAVTVQDGLFLHSGFGCPIGSGFGLSPFGK